MAGEILGIIAGDRPAGGPPNLPPCGSWDQRDRDSRKAAEHPECLLNHSSASYRQFHTAQPACGLIRRVSVPRAPKQSCAATAEAAPEEDPPAIQSRLQGLRATPKALMTPLPPYASSCRLSLPSSTAPANLQTPHNFSIVLWHAGLEESAGGCGAHSSGIDKVLQCQGDAVKRPAPISRRDFRFGRARLVQCLLRGDGDEGVQARVELLNPLQASLGESRPGRSFGCATVRQLRAD